MAYDLIIRRWGTTDYKVAFDAMKLFTQERSLDCVDEVWLIEHPPVFTQGQAGKPEHILNPGNIPVVQTDRGGQVTYHGPGQLVMYVLFDLRRLQIGIRQLVNRLEQTVIDALEDYEIKGQSKCDAPGVYVDQAKICSIGLRVKKGCSYHGIALNVDMSLEPFSRINPCGFQNLKVTQIKNFQPNVTLCAIETKIVAYLQKNFGYNHPHFVSDNKA